jgi:hypothetical protein
MELNTILMRDSMVLIIEKNIKQAVKRLLVLESPLATTLLVSDHQHEGFQYLNQFSSGWSYTFCSEICSKLDIE